MYNKKPNWLLLYVTFIFISDYILYRFHWNEIITALSIIGSAKHQGVTHSDIKKVCFIIAQSC